VKHDLVPAIAGAMLSATFLAACRTPDVDQPDGASSTVTVAYCCGDESSCS
jgi:hypothetical protein